MFKYEDGFSRLACYFTPLLDKLNAPSGYLSAETLQRCGPVRRCPPDNIRIASREYVFISL